MFISQDNRPWRPSILAKRPDHIESSEYTYDKKVPNFRPSTDKEEINMFHLLSMEYSRVWHREKDELLSKTVFRPVDNDFIQRKYVIRGLLAKKKHWEKKAHFKMKKFENVPSRIHTQKKPEIEALDKEFKLTKATTSTNRKKVDDCTNTRK